MVVNGHMMDNNLSVPQMDFNEMSALADQFVLQYYTVMNKCPELLHRFYKEDSSLIYENDPIFGQENIHRLFMDLHFNDTRVLIHKVDALRANHNSVLIQVCGELSIANTSPRRFMRSFTLCERCHSDFYVLSDILRFQDKVFIPEARKTNSKETPSKSINSPSNVVSQANEVFRNHTPVSPQSEKPLERKEPRKSKKERAQRKTVLQEVEASAKEQLSPKIDSQELIQESSVATSNSPPTSAKKTWADRAAALPGSGLGQGAHPISATYQVEQAPSVFSQLNRDPIISRNQDIGNKQNQPPRPYQMESSRTFSAAKQDVRPRGGAPTGVRGPSRGSNTGGRMFDSHGPGGADQRRK